MPLDWTRGEYSDTQHSKVLGTVMMLITIRDEPRMYWTNIAKGMNTYIPIYPTVYNIDMWQNMRFDIKNFGHAL